MTAATGGDGADVVVLRGKVHGMSADRYAESLRKRLPDREVVVARSPADERAALRQAPVATGIRLDEADLAVAEDLRLFACVWAGVGHLPLAAFEDRGVAVTNASGVHGPNIAEYVVGSLVAFARNFRRAWRQEERGEWRRYEARELQGSTVTVVGMGAIGTATVERLSAFGVETVGVRHSPGKDGPTDDVLGYDDLHEGLARADHLVLACPLTDETRGLIDAEAFRTLPSHAVLVNVARGPVVDTDALVDACRGNFVGGAVLDVTDPEPLPGDHPLWDLGNVMITPHNAGHTPHYYDRVAEILAENLDRVAETGGYEDLRNQVV
jgi:phosphoglycerate dehydrogenase-like enzyme